MDRWMNESSISFLLSFFECVLYHKSSSDIFSCSWQLVHIEYTMSSAWHRKHEPLTSGSQTVPAVKQRGSYSLWAASCLAVLPLPVFLQLHQQLCAAKWKCSGSVNIFSLDGFVFITHTPGAPLKSVHSVFCIYGETCALGAFSLDKLITELYFFQSENLGEEI